MTTQLAKQVIDAVRKNTGGNAESYYRAKYVTVYGKTVFHMMSGNGRDWVIDLNTLEPERTETIFAPFYAAGQLRRAA
jgi:hypothetical protein